MSAFAYNFQKHLSDGDVDLDTNQINLVLVDVTQLGAGNGGLITGATNATPIVVTSNSHGLANGERITIGKVGGNTAANGVFKVANVATNTFDLVDARTGDNIAGSGSYTSGGNWMLCDATMDDLADIPSGARSSDLINCGSATIAGGRLSLANSPFTISGCGSGDLVHKILYYKHNATEGSAFLLYIDDDDSGLPLTGNGENVTLTLPSDVLVDLYA